MESQDQQKEEELRFLFGKNWNNFIQFHFSEERVNISKNNTEHALPKIAANVRVAMATVCTLTCVIRLFFVLLLVLLFEAGRLWGEHSGTRFFDVFHVIRSSTHAHTKVKK
mgnify:CR=1 FL=1